MGECLIIRSGGGTDTSGATATAARVLSGYTCYVNDVKITGTMANQGTKNASLNAGGSYTIPAGYHSGSGKVTANALSGQTSATATAARILSGRTAWVNGSKLTGTMTNRGAISQKLAANGSYTVPAGWHNGSGKVTQSLTTQGAKNVTPKTTNQTACAASRWTTGNIVIVGSSTLKAGNIKKGVKIFNVTGTWVGWVDSTIPVTNYIYHTAFAIYPTTTTVNRSKSYKFIKPLDGTTYSAGYAYAESYYNWAVKLKNTFSKIRCIATFWATPNWATSTTITMTAYKCVVEVAPLKTTWYLMSSGLSASANLTSTQSSVTLETAISASDGSPIGGIEVSAKASTSTNVSVGIVSWSIVAVK